MNRWRNTAACLLSLSVLASCAGSFAYNRLDYLIPWYVDAYVDLTSEQRQSLRDQLVPILQWHRREELARYQQLLYEIQAALEHQITPGQVQIWGDELLQAVTRTEETMLELALEFGTSISAEQMEEFIESLNEKQEEYEEEFLSRTNEEYAEENTKQLQKLLKRFLGPLNNEQKERLEQGALSLQRFDNLWLEDRRQWLDQLEPLLARKPGWQEDIRTAFRHRNENRPAQYQQNFEHNTRVMHLALVDVFNSRTAKQRASTREELQDLQKILQKLMDAAGAAAGDPLAQLHMNQQKWITTSPATAVLWSARTPD